MGLEAVAGLLDLTGAATAAESIGTVAGIADAATAIDTAASLGAADAFAGGIDAFGNAVYGSDIGAANALSDAAAYNSLPASGYSSPLGSSLNMPSMKQIQNGLSTANSLNKLINPQSYASPSSTGYIPTALATPGQTSLSGGASELAGVPYYGSSPKLGELKQLQNGIVPMLAQVLYQRGMNVQQANAPQESTQGDVTMTPEELANYGEGSDYYGYASGGVVDSSVNWLTHPSGSGGASKTNSVSNSSSSQSSSNNNAAFASFLNAVAPLSALRTALSSDTGKISPLAYPSLALHKMSDAIALPAAWLTYKLSPDRTDAPAPVESRDTFSPDAQAEANANSASEGEGAGGMSAGFSAPGATSGNAGALGFGPSGMAAGVGGFGGDKRGGAIHEAKIPAGHKPEFITGHTGHYVQGRGTGQSDDIPAVLHDGDYVVDADTVAALGDGSSKAGGGALEQFRRSLPEHHSGGGQPIPAQIADGEYVLPAGFVTTLGHGSNKEGAKMLDAMREQIRAHKRSAPDTKIPPKAKSPLQYLKEATKG